MRALVYSDLQATDGHERCYSDPTKLLQLYRVERFYDELLKIYKERHCDCLFDLGDTTDDRTAIPVSVIDLLCDKLEAFEGEWNLKLVGNHEQFLRDTRIHAGKMFRRFFRVVDTCEVIKAGKVNILCASYHDDMEAIVDFICRQPKKSLYLLLGHFQVSGCQMSSGTAITGVSREHLKLFQTGLLGHIHKPQTLGNIHYVGSPFQQHWGEAGDQKRVAVVDIEDENIEITFVPLKGFPVYRQVTFSEFERCVKEVSEDRYKVVLTSLDETEKFYAHPLYNRADEAIYAYTDKESGTPATESGSVLPQSKRDILEMYVKQSPPKNYGVVLDNESMLEFGEEITLLR